MKRILKKSAFSLIELLIVISIIALLAGMLMPALSKAKGKGKSASCQNNMKQLLSANAGYAVDYGCFAPYAGSASGMATNIMTWAGWRDTAMKININKDGYLTSYLNENRTVMICPEWTKTGDITASSGAGYGYNKDGVGSMAYLDSTKTGPPGMKPEKITKASTTVAFTDAANAGGMSSVTETQGTLVIYPRVNYAGTARWGYTHFRHHNQANAGWCDGHVSVEKPTQFQDNDLARREKVGWIGDSNDNAYKPIQ